MTNSGLGKNGSIIWSTEPIIKVRISSSFRRGLAQGIETTAVFEPSTLVAIIVYAVITLGIVKLLRVLSGEQQVD